MDPISIIAVVGTVGKTAVEVGQSLYKLARDTKQTDQTVADLAAEVETLGETCNSVQLQLQSVVADYGATQRGGEQLARFWSSTQVKLEECRITVRRLEIAIQGVRTSKANVIAQIWQQARLNLSQDEIVEIRSRIRSHTTALQISLQVINITISHLAPRYADQTLLGKLDALQRKLDELAPQQKSGSKVRNPIEDDFLQYAVEVLSSGNSLYESSVAGGSLFGGSNFGDAVEAKKSIAQIPDWIRSVQAIGLKDSLSEHTPADSGLGPSLSSDGSVQRRTTTERTPIQDADDEEWDDEFEIGVARKALQLGREAIEAEDYAEADGHLQAAFETIQQISTHHRKLFDIRELQYLIAICAFHLRDSPVAETALVSFLENPGTSSPTEAIQLCHIGHLLAQVYVRLGKVDFARSSCHGAVRGRWKLLGETDPSYHESLALLARIHELQGHTQKAKLYSSMIDQASRESLGAMFRDLTFSKERACTTWEQDSTGQERPLPRPLAQYSYSQDDESVSSFPADESMSSRVNLLSAERRSQNPMMTLSPPPVSFSTSQVHLAPFPTGELTSTIAIRSRQLQALGLVTRNELQEALVAGNSQRALRLLNAYRPRSFGSALTPLHLAALFGELEIAQALVSCCDVNASCKISGAYGGKATALNFAIVARSTAMIRLLVANGAIITPKKVKTKTGSSFQYFPPAPVALKWWLDLGGPAEPEECIEILRTFLSLGWDINNPIDSLSRTMLHLAVRLPQEKAHIRAPMVNFLMQEGADVLARSTVRCIPLHFASRWNESPETVTRLLQTMELAQVTAKDDYGNTALHDAVWNRRDHGPKVSIEILKSLLVAGGKVNEKNWKGETPMSIAGVIKGRREHHDDAEAASLIESYAS